MVPKFASSEVLSIYSTDHKNGTLQLTINSLLSFLLGTYTCNATNARGIAVGTTAVFGPPPPPPSSDFGVNVNERTVVISWKRPTSTDIVVTKYRVTIYR